MEFKCEEEPAVYSGSNWKEWKESLSECIKDASENTPCYPCVILHFRGSARKRNGQPFDLDNLAEPIFRVLVGKKKYFSGKRSNIKWWMAERVISSPPEVEITLSDKEPSFDNLGRKVFEGYYRGALPKSARDEAFSEWVKSLLNATPVGEKFAVHLTFPVCVNIGDIATGAVKHVIDNLYAVFGGKAGSPEDWKIGKLFVEKNSLLTEGVKIVITNL